MTQSHLDVLVVGAGPVGLFCANELIRHGLKCRIIDKKSTLSTHSKALGLHIRTLDVLEDCGLIDEVLKQGHQVEGVLFKSKGQVLINASFDEIKVNRDYLIDLPQDKSEAILYQNLKTKGHDVEWDTELTGYKQNTDLVHIEIKQSNGETETVKANWVIACDGAHSRSRHLLKADFEGSKYDKNWWLADLLIDWDLPDNRMVIYISEHGPLACFPMGNQRYRLVMTAPENQVDAPTLADIQKAFLQRSSDKAELSQPFWITQFNIHHRQIKEYRHERIFLAGDAAHIHSPMGGQGLNTGIQDVYNLVWKLALVQKNKASPEILNSYQLERYPVGQNVLKKTDIMTRMILLTHPWAIAARNYFMRFMLSIQRIRKAMIRDIAELTISYRNSPIVDTTQQIRTLKAGEYCPEFKLMNIKSQRLESSREFLKGTSHHLLIFAGMSKANSKTLTQQMVALAKPYHDMMTVHLILTDAESPVSWEGPLWIDQDLTVHTSLALEEPSMILIRPDKYIAMLQRPVNTKQLSTYLAQWFTGS